MLTWIKQNRFVLRYGLTCPVKALLAIAAAYEAVELLQELIERGVMRSSLSGFEPQTAAVSGSQAWWQFLGLMACSIIAGLSAHGVSSDFHSLLYALGIRQERLLKVQAWTALAAHCCLAIFTFYSVTTCLAAFRRLQHDSPLILTVSGIRLDYGPAVEDFAMGIVWGVLAMFSFLAAVFTAVTGCERLQLLQPTATQSADS